LLKTSKVQQKRFKVAYALGMIVFLALLISACAPAAETAPGSNQEEPDAQERQAPETMPESTSTPALGVQPGASTPPSREALPTTRLPERVPVETSPASSAVVGEAPAELLEAIKSDLAGRTGAASDEMRVVRDQAMVFSDGSLGCPQPGMFYTQATVAGYWVVLELEQVEYDYRATEKGTFILCEGGLLPGLTPPGDLPGPIIAPEQ
jgi:hypothetical protein